MKKVLSFVLGCLLALGFFNIVSAQGLTEYLNADFLKSFPTTFEFGYKGNENLTVDSISDTSIVIKSPVIEDKYGMDVTSYNLYFSTTFFDPNDVSSIDGSTRFFTKKFTNVPIRSDRTFTLELTTNDGLDKSSVYYLFVEPVDDFGEGGGPSYNRGEICFRLQDKLSGMDRYCELHKATSSIYSITGISHVIVGNKITLTWNSLSDGNVEISRWDGDKFILLSSVNMNDRSYTFDARESTDHLLKFRPLDGSQEINYTAHYNASSKPDVTPVVTQNPSVKPVVVGPKENIILIIAGSIVLYLLYKFMKRKA